jgi:UDP-glucuronate decarboxylase
MNIDSDIDGPVNLGNPFEVTIAELAKRIVALAGSRSVVNYHPLPQDDPRQRCPDITRARQLLHWSPKTELDDGLTKTITYFDSLLRQSSSAKELAWRVAV